MASEFQKLLAQIALNLLMIFLLIIALAAVVGEFFSPDGDLKKAIFFLVLLGGTLFIGIGLLVRLIRQAIRKEKP